MAHEKFDLPPGATRANEVEYWAALGNVERVRAAIKAGHDVNQIGEDGYTALHAAAENAHHEVIEILLQHGANKAAIVTSGETPADLARLAGHDDIAQMLT